MDRARFAELAAAFAGQRLVVLGDLMLDRYMAGPADRVSPEAPVPVVRVEREWHAAGGAANVAANVLALGAQCDVIGVVGEDRAARSLRGALEAMGGGCRFVREGNWGTTVKTRVLARDQQVVRMDRERVVPATRATQSALGARLDECLPGAAGLLLADYDKGALSAESIRRAIDLATGLGIPVIADPKRSNFFAFQGATVFKPNRAELEAARGGAARPDDADWMEAARVSTGARHLLVTLGGCFSMLAILEQLTHYADPSLYRLVLLPLLRLALMSAVALLLAAATGARIWWRALAVPAILVLPLVTAAIAYGDVIRRPDLAAAGSALAFLATLLPLLRRYPKEASDASP